MDLGNQPSLPGVNFRVHSVNPLKHFSSRTKTTRSLDVPKEIKGEKNLLPGSASGEDTALAVSQMRFVHGKRERRGNPCLSRGHHRLMVGRVSAPERVFPSSRFLLFTVKASVNSRTARAGNGTLARSERGRDLNPHSRCSGAGGGWNRSLRCEDRHGEAREVGAAVVSMAEEPQPGAGLPSRTGPPLSQTCVGEAERPRSVALGKPRAGLERRQSRELAAAALWQ